MLKRSVLFMATLCLIPAALSIADNTIDLSGQWRFALDRADEGQQQSWFETKLPGDNTVQLQVPCRNRASAIHPVLPLPGWVIFAMMNGINRSIVHIGPRKISRCLSGFSRKNITKALLGTRNR